MESDEMKLSRLRLYLRAHWNDAQRIEALAQCTFKQLRADARILSTSDPVQQLRVIAARVLTRDTEAMVIALRDGEFGQERSLDENPHRHLVRALIELPPEHARLFLAHRQQRLSSEEISERFAISLSMTTLYLSQARALVRMCGWRQDSRPDKRGEDYQRTLLTAQQAAHWLVQSSNGRHANHHLEFLRWLRQDLAHVRELLMALAFEDALDAPARPIGCT